MKRHKIVYNLRVCHHPVTTSFNGKISMNDAYIECSYNISVGFESTCVALEQPSFSNFIFRTTSYAYTTRSSFINKTNFDAVVFCGAHEPIGEISMAPEVIDHGIDFFTFGAIIPDACQIPSDDLDNSSIATSINEIGYIIVDGIPEPPFTNPIKFFHPFRCSFVITLHQITLTFGDSLIPVPPVSQKGSPVVGDGFVYTFDVGNQRISNSNINIGLFPVMPNWLRDGLCFHRHVSIPFTSLVVVLDFEFSLLAGPSKISHNPASDLPDKSNGPSFDLVTITSDEQSWYLIVSFSIFPVSWRRHFSNMGWQFILFFEFEKLEERSPGGIILSDDGLSGRSTYTRTEGLVFLLGVPVNLTLEKGLSSLVIDNVPECRTSFGDLEDFFMVSEFDSEGVGAFHTKIEYNKEVFKDIGEKQKGGIVR